MVSYKDKIEKVCEDYGVDWKLSHDFTDVSYYMAFLGELFEIIEKEIKRK